MATEEIKRDPFGGIIPAKFPSKCDERLIEISGFTKDENGKTVYGVVSTRDIVKEVNSPENKNLAGLAAAIRLIASGQATPNQFADDGKGGGVFPSEAAEPGLAWEAAQKAQAIFEKAKADLAAEGLDFSGIASADDPNAYIEKVVSERVKTTSAEVAAAGGDVK